ncbi:MAG: Bax inhibitor-1 family protein [Lachnospiraceae bacterium]|nr:Bax inhibitor-1 family protein [Lachnospiraceae bacterium]
MANNNLFQLDKEARFNVGEDVSFVSDRQYNLTVGGITAYGLIANALTCFYFPGVRDKNVYIFILIAYIVCALAGTAILRSSRNPIISFLGYNMIAVPMGFMLAIVVNSYAPAIVFNAVGTTASVVVIMVCFSMLFPQVFLSMGRALFISLIVTVVAGFVMMFISPFNTTIYDFLVAGLFSLYIAYDWAKSNQYPKTLNNAIWSACDIYLDIVNLFLRILRLLGRKK